MSDTVDTLVRGTVVNVNTGKREEQPVAIDNGRIVALEERPAEREIETSYITPGLIDAHVHIESSMVTVPRYGEIVVPRGVTSVVHDPHEIANVLGTQGVRDVVADASHTPLKARFTAPSSVPASHLQDAGAEITAESVEELLDEDSVVALGEVMNIPGVLNDDTEIHAKITAARERGLPVDGHAPRVTGSALQKVSRYLDNDHESIHIDEAREKAAAGLRVYLREGSASKNLEDLVELVDEVDTRRLSLCTDDRDIVDLMERGGIDHAVEKAIAHGVDPVQAVQMATINTAESYNLPFGRIEPGAPADLVLLDDLESWAVEHVLIDGELDPTTDSPDPPGSELGTDSVTFDTIRPVDLAISQRNPGPVTVQVIDAIGGLQTARMTAEVAVDTDDPPVGIDGVGAIEPAIESDVLPIATIERHSESQNIGRGFVHRLGIERGAVGMTVAHDAHNCIVAGSSYTAMARVANHLRAIGGGVATYDSRSEEFTSLALPVAGLMSELPAEKAKTRFEAVERAAFDIGFSHDGGLMELSFLALEVIPEYRLSNKGLIDVDSFDVADVVLDPP